MPRRAAHRCGDWTAIQRRAAPPFLFMHQACGALAIQIDDLPPLHHEDWGLKQ